MLTFVVNKLLIFINHVLLGFGSSHFVKTHSALNIIRNLLRVEVAAEPNCKHNIDDYCLACNAKSQNSECHSTIDVGEDPLSNSCQEL